MPASFLFLSISNCRCKEIFSFSRYLLDFSRTSTFPISSSSLSLVYILNIADVRGQEYDIDAIRIIGEVCALNELFPLYHRLVVFFCCSTK